MFVCNSNINENFFFLLFSRQSSSLTIALYHTDTHLVSWIFDDEIIGEQCDAVSFPKRNIWKTFQTIPNLLIALLQSLQQFELVIVMRIQRIHLPPQQKSSTHKHFV